MQYSISDHRVLLLSVNNKTQLSLGLNAAHPVLHTDALSVKDLTASEQDVVQQFHGLFVGYNFRPTPPTHPV